MDPEGHSSGGSCRSPFWVLALLFWGLCFGRKPLDLTDVGFCEAKIGRLTWPMAFGIPSSLSCRSWFTDSPKHWMSERNTPNTKFQHQSILESSLNKQIEKYGTLMKLTICRFGYYKLRFFGLVLSDLIFMMDIHGATCPSATCPSMRSWNSAPIQRACAVHAAPLGPRVPDPPRTSPHSPGPTVAPTCARTRFCLRKKPGKLHRGDERWGLQEDFIGILLGFYDVCWFINPISYII